MKTGSVECVKTDLTVITKLSGYSDFSVMKTNEEILLNLATKLKGLRTIKGVTQEQVYNDTGIHVARIEQGKRDISFTTLCKLADYFSVELTAFN